MICSICCRDIDIQYTQDGEVQWSKGHNPSPITTGLEDRCCSYCNATVVIPERLRRSVRLSVSERLRRLNDKLPKNAVKLGKNK